MKESGSGIEGILEDPRDTRVRRADKNLLCQFCGHDRFRWRNGLMNTPGMTFFNLDWANKSADCFICKRCGYVHWFMAGKS